MAFFVVWKTWVAERSGNLLLHGHSGNGPQIKMNNSWVDAKHRLWIKFLLKLPSSDVLKKLFVSSLLTWLHSNFTAAKAVPADSNRNDWNDQSCPYNDPLKQLSLLIWNMLQKSSIKYHSDSISKTFIFTLLMRTFSNISFCLLHVSVILVKFALPNTFDGGSMLNRVRWWKNHLETFEEYQSYCLNG